jgi:hypothetical protein
MAQAPQKKEVCSANKPQTVRFSIDSIGSKLCEAWAIDHHN